MRSILRGTTNYWLAATLLVACGFPTLGLVDNPGDATTPSTEAPSSVTYAATFAIYPEGFPITANTPTVVGGSPSSYSIAPALPDGLGLDAVTGLIAGTPATESTLASYTVTATNAGGAADTPIMIGVNSNGVLAAGTGHTCARVNGGAQCWGDNALGDLGNGHPNAPSSVPVAVTNLASGVQALAAGGQHTCALVNGGVLCWGDGTKGVLGNNAVTNSSIPAPVIGASLETAVAAGGQDTCTAPSGCFGGDSYGQLGDGGTTESHVAVPVSGLSSGVHAVTVGYSHACAIVNGGAECWGMNYDGELGNSDAPTISPPVPVTGLGSGVQAIATAATGFHTCAVVNGAAMCWGMNGSGQLGDNSTTTRRVPVVVSGLGTGVQAVTAGSSHTCALVNAGVQCWGANGHGELGNNSTTNSSIPVAVIGLSDGVQAIVAGDNHTCALVHGGIKCWGENSSGQLGDGSTSTRLVPVGVFNLASGVQP